MNTMLSPEDGFNYSAYVLIYMDDVMVINHDAKNILIIIYKYFNLNTSSIREPDIYLGSKLEKMRPKNGVWAWANSLARYLKGLVANIEKYLFVLDNARWQFPKKKTESPFVEYYAPEMDKNPALEE